jgi:predicted CXXCH cytochrome family protein
VSCRPKPPRLRCRFVGALAFGTVLALTLVAGCSGPTQQRWLTFFFDGVPTNKTPAQATALITPATTNALTNAVGQVTQTNAPPPKPYIHPPYATRQCKECHVEVFSQKMQGKPGEVCLNCHDHANFKASLALLKFKHNPVEAGDCKGCHQPHLATNTNLLRQTGMALCWECHDNFLEKAKVKHQPVQTEGCLVCHRPHGADHAKLLAKSPKATCAECHDDVPPKVKVPHPPVADGDCIACHTPHAGDLKHLVKKPGAALCWECHDNFLEKTKVKHQPVAAGECVACHRPHGSDQKALLVKAGPNLCWECHDNFLEKAKFKHKAVETDGCLGCHSPHASDKKGLLKKTGAALCWECHDNFLEKAKFKHQPAAEGDCLACHRPHAAESATPEKCVEKRQRTPGFSENASRAAEMRASASRELVVLANSSKARRASPVSLPIPVAALSSIPPASPEQASRHASRRLPISKPKPERPSARRGEAEAGSSPTYWMNL